MKPQSYLAIVVLCFFTIVITPSSSKAEVNSIVNHSQFVIAENEDLDYERVYSFNMWWIYVYDNGVLIDVYPE